MSDENLALQPPFEITPKMTMAQILALMSAVDDGSLELSDDDMKLLGSRLELKVDGYQAVLEQYELDAARLARRIKEFQEAKAMVVARFERLEKLLSYHMQAHGLKKMPGEDYKVTLKSSQSVVPRREPEMKDYLEHKDFVKRSFEWKKNEIKKAIKAGDEAAIAIAELRTKFTPNFSVNKGKADE